MRELLPATLSDDVIAQRGVELLRLTQPGAIQGRFGQVGPGLHGCGAEPAVDQGFDRRARRGRARFAKHARHPAAARQARLATRGKRREQLPHGFGERRVHHNMVVVRVSCQAWRVSWSMVGKWQAGDRPRPLPGRMVLATQGGAHNDVSHRKPDPETAGRECRLAQGCHRGADRDLHYRRRRGQAHLPWLLDRGSGGEHHL